MTDKEARPLSHKDGRILPSYNQQSAVDGKYGVVCALRTTQKPDEQADLLPLTDAANRNTQGQFQNVLADCGYGGYELYEQTESEESQRKETFYIPNRRTHAQQEGKLLKAGYALEFFKLDEGGNYICPAGSPMSHKKRVKRLKHEVDIYLGTGCGTCPVKANCTKSATRRLQVDTRIRYQQQMNAKLASDKGWKIYSKRQGIVEPVHGDDQKNQAWRQHHLRGLSKAAAEFTLVRIGTNLKKIVKYRAGELLALR